MLKFLTFVVTAENHPDVLARAVLLLHRLAIPIRALTMIRPERSARMHITIHLKLEPARAPRIAANLLKIVHVLSVEARTQDAQSAARTERLLTPMP
jgi:acetolactate synthase small subunit